MTICYFTASGNCLYVARRIGGTLLSIPQLMRQEKIEIEDDAVGIVCPVYAVELPFMIVDFMKKADIKTDYFFFILTCGYGYEVSLGHAEVAARERGWDLKYGNGVFMVDNYLPFFDMAEEISKLPGKNVEGQLDAICADIQARKERRVNLTPELKEQMAHYHKNHAPKVIDKNMALDYTVNDDCIRCGICAKVCPAKNITVTENGVQFSDHCEVCYACLHNCPQHAIHLPKEAGRTQFRNEHVTLADIIKANE